MIHELIVLLFFSLIKYVFAIILQTMNFEE